MARFLMLTLFAFFAAAPLMAAEPAKADPAKADAAKAAEDELTTVDEETLVGKFIKIDGGKVFFESDSLGLQKIEIKDVATITLGAPHTMYLRGGDEDHHTYTKVVLATTDGKLTADGKPFDFAKAGTLTPEPIDERADWSVNFHAAFGWTEGNTKTYQADARFDIVRNTTHNYMTLFGEANYSEDRLAKEDKVTERNFLLGFAYRYIFNFNLTIDVTEDITWNELAGYHYRSVTGVGPGYYFCRKPELTAHVGLHLVYVYEDLTHHADNHGYWGARLRGEVDTVQCDGDLHANFKTELIFDFSDGKNIMWNSQLMVDYEFAQHFSAGLLIRDSFDNVPPLGFKRHDMSFLLTIGFSWGGKWY